MELLKDTTNRGIAFLLLYVLLSIGVALVMKYGTFVAAFFLAACGMYVLNFFRKVVDEYFNEEME